MNSQDSAGFSKFAPSKLCQFLVCLCSAAMRPGLPRSEANHRSLNSEVRVFPQGPAKASRLVIRMCGDAQQPIHVLILPNVHSFAEILQFFAAGEMVTRN